MDTAHETSLLAKALWSAGIVMTLAFIAERIGARIAGLLAGAPLSAVLVYFFVGRDVGVGYIVDSVPHGIASFSGTLAFVLIYYWVSSRLTRFPGVGGAAAAIAGYLAIAWVLVAIPFTLASATTLTVLVIVISTWLLRRIEFVPVERPVRYTAHLLLIRGGVAAVLIIVVIMLAETLGPRWTGLMVGFPTTLLPTLLILHFTYGMATTHAVIRNFPIGMGSIILYILSVPYSFTQWGVYGGTAASLAASFAYLSVIMLFGQRWLSPAKRLKGGPAKPE